MLNTPSGPLYPIWRVTASFNDQSGIDIIAESEMIGNIINQVGKGLDLGYDTILIKRTEDYVDARVPR